MNHFTLTFIPYKFREAVESTTRKRLIDAGHSRSNPLSDRGFAHAKGWSSPRIT